LHAVSNVGDELEFMCPHCGQGVAFAVADVAQTLVCPHCQAEFVAPARDGAIDIADLNEQDESPDLPDEALNAIRVRQLSAERRATYRASSYCMIAAIVCAVAIAQLCWMIVQHLRRRGGWGLQCTGYAMFIALATWGLVYFLLRARQLHREAKQSALVEPEHPPDFSTLDDGSKQVVNLEELR
jgi:hypothetical protein